MKIEEILQLKESGFTVDDIVKLVPLMAEKKEEVKPEVKPEVKVEPAKTEVKVENNDSNKEIMDKLNELSTLLHISNINSAKGEDPKTVDDVIAEVINPRYKEDRKKR